MKKKTPVVREFDALQYAKTLEEQACNILAQNMEYAEDGMVANDAAFKLILLSQRARETLQ